MRFIGDAVQWGIKNARQVADFISKDGAGRAILTPNMGDMARSASYNKLASAAQGIIDTMGPDEAKAVRQLINKGEDFTTEAFSRAWTAMSEGDEAAQKVAESFADVAGKFGKADLNAMQTPANAVSEYAEFLGREDGRLGLINSLDGYFGDKQHGVRRIHTAVGAAAGIGIANRLLSGGSLTRTNTGERDIAGVPFF